MHLKTRYATKVGAASISLLAVTVFFSLGAHSQSQDPPQQKPAAPAASQSPSPEPKKLGTELDDRSLITNTDLITLTVTVTDTYGRYVSGLSKGAFAVSITNSNRRSRISATTTHPYQSESSSTSPDQ